MPKYTIYIRKDNADHWNAKPQHTRSDWINRKLEEERAYEANQKEALKAQEPTPLQQESNGVDAWLDTL